MNTREEIKKAIDTLPEEALEGVLDYVRFIQEPEEVEPTEADIRAIARGKEEMARGEVVRWKEIKKNVL